MDLFRRLTLFFCLMFALCAASAVAMPDMTRGRIIAADETAGVETLAVAGVIEKANNNVKLIVFDAAINKDRASGYIQESLSQPDINT